MKTANAFIIGLILIFIFGVSSINAATLTVTKAANSNDGVCDADCSLREAVATANFGDDIVFSPSLVGQTFTLGGNNIEIDKNLTIDGNLDGVNVAFISGGGTSRHFLVLAGGNLHLKNAILVNGNGMGSGIINGAGSIEVNGLGFLYLDRVAIRSNSSPGTGGAIKFNGNSPSNHIITNSSITSNTARSAPAIFNNKVNLHISNTTISNNRVINADANGWGAIANFGNLIMRNCTVVNNQARNGGGIVAFSSFNPNTNMNEFTNLGNTIVAENTATDSGQDILFFSNLASVGGNLIGDTNTIPGGTFNQMNDAVNLNPLLAPTNSNQGGHPIDTHPLQAGSPARNTGRNSLAVEPLFGTPLSNDARGTGFPRISGGTVDKGAFEDQSSGSTLIVTKLTNSNDFVCDTDCSLREAVYAASIDAGTDNITMAANVFGTMNVGTEIAIENHDVNIIGYPSISSNTLIISGNNTSRVFNTENANVTMTGFTIANGNGAGGSQPFGGGGMLVGGGNLTLNQMVIRNNATAASDLGSGGGLTIVSGVVVRIMNSTINNNSSYGSLGASIDASVVYITNTTIANNFYIPPGEAGFGALSINGTLYMRNSTIANNRNPNSTTGAGLFCGGSTTCNIGNSVFGDNSAMNGADLYVAPGGTLNSVGGNLVENTTGYNTGILSQTNDQTGIDAGLMTLGDNGGNVTTMGLSPTSPAINAGINSVATDPYSAAVLPSDARGGGFSRIVSTVDKGAYETLIPTAGTTTVSGRVTNGKSGLPNVQVYLSGQNGVLKTVMTNSLGYYSFDEIEVGQIYVLSATSKRYQFNSRIVNVMDEVANADIVAN